MSSLVAKPKSSLLRSVETIDTANAMAATANSPICHGLRVFQIVDTQHSKPGEASIARAGT
ncbi:MAG: hypothetical protein ACOYPS_09495 [Phycisphaerales bacterium]